MKTCEFLSSHSDGDWKLLSFEMRGHAVFWYIVTIVSEEPAASIFTLWNIGGYVLDDVASYPKNISLHGNSVLV
jgi:hypothetical protein